MSEQDKPKPALRTWEYGNLGSQNLDGVVLNPLKKFIYQIVWSWNGEDHGLESKALGEHREREYRYLRDGFEKWWEAENKEVA